MSDYKIPPDPIYDTVTPLNSAASTTIKPHGASTSGVEEMQLDDNMAYVSLFTPHESNIISVKNTTYERVIPSNIV